MKNRAIILCGIGLLIGSTAMAQKTMSSGISPKAGISTDLVGNKNTPVSPLPVKGIPVEAWRSPSNRNNQINGNTNINKPENRPVSPLLKADDGVIWIDFGIAQQGDHFSTFFPFNIKTLEREVSMATSVISRSEYIRYAPFGGSESGIKDVSIAFKAEFQRQVNNTMSGNGFDLKYNADKPGAVDEMVMVYTTQGNIIYRLTGYVLSKETAVTVVDNKK